MTLPPEPKDPRSLAGTIGGLSLLSLGHAAVSFLIQILVAFLFGTSGPYESFLVALSIPNLFGYFLLLGGVSTVVIPLYLEQRALGEEQAWKFLSSFLNAFLLLGLILTVLGWWLAPVLMRASAPGLSPDRWELGARMLRWLFLTLAPSFLQIVCVSVLNAHRIFLLPQALTLGVSVANLLALTWLQDRFGVWILVATTLAMYLPGPLLIALHWRTLFHNYRPRLDLGQPALRKSLGLLALMSFIALSNQLNFMSDRFFASWLPTGSIAVYEYAGKIVPAFIAVFLQNIVRALYPRLARSAADRRGEAVAQDLVKGLRATAFLLLPAAAFCVLYREPLFIWLFERGQFSAQAALQAAGVFPWLAGAFVFWGLAQITVSTLYAMQGMGIMAWLTGVGVFINILGDWLLVGPLGLKGLALASSVSAAFGFAATLRCLKRRLPALDLGALALFALKLGAGLAALALTAVLLSGFPDPGARFGALGIRLAACLAAGGLAYGGTLLLLGVEEAGRLIHLVRKGT